MSDSSRSQDDHEEQLKKAGVVDVPCIELDIPALERAQRPLPVSHLSTPAHSSPLRHHRRASSRNTHVKETLNAKSHYGNDDDGAHAVHKLNQYILGQEIGRGSFGCVRLAKDQYNNEFAIKEFSKSRLRKRAKSNLLRRPGPRKIGTGLLTGFMPATASTKDGDCSDAFDLIKSEIAVMKKLDHPNLVSLIEVLDDPDEDSLYMVLELCKKGVVMKVDLDKQADPYNEDTCRLWFRDLVLGLEYLHAQGIIHRDLKPDNCLITEDDVLKIVDFGVSEMFDKASDMSTSKSTGSPAFMPPELCVADHGNVSGRAVDIWSMGVTLYCLKFGRIPFSRENLMDLYEAIKSEELSLDDGASEHFCDLITRLLDKDPNTRIKMPEIRTHPWVTAGGKDLLLSEEENCNHIVDEPTDAEIHEAITGNMGRVFAVARAVKQFKRLLRRKRPEILDGILGHSSRYVDSPASTDQRARNLHRVRSQDTFNRRPLEYVLAAEGVHHSLDIDDSGHVTPHSANSRAPSSRRDADAESNRDETSPDSHSQSHIIRSPGASRTRSLAGPLDHPDRHLTEDEHTRGHAHDPSSDTLYLHVGSGPSSGDTDGANDNIICESPGASEDAIYERAYEEELKRIIADRGKEATTFLTRRVDHKRELRELGNAIDKSLPAAMEGVSGGLAGIAQKLKAQNDAKTDVDAAEKDAEADGEMDNT